MRRYTSTKILKEDEHLRHLKLIVSIITINSNNNLTKQEFIGIKYNGKLIR